VTDLPGRARDVKQQMQKILSLGASGPFFKILKTLLHALYPTQRMLNGGPPTLSLEP